MTYYYELNKLKQMEKISIWGFLLYAKQVEIKKKS